MTLDPPVARFIQDRDAQWITRLDDANARVDEAIQTGADYNNALSRIAE